MHFSLKIKVECLKNQIKKNIILDGVDEFRKRSNTAGAISKENVKRWTKRWQI